jgi:flagellar biosynthesis/type III secretory pathway M-ring protein FliF/YscJ
MSTHAHAGHVGHEMEDFQGIYAIWAIPFSFVLLVVFLAIVTLWVPASASRELRLKEAQGAEVSRQWIQEQRADEARVLAGGEGMSISEAMAEVVRKNGGR